MNVHTELRCGIVCGNTKFQVNTFIHYQDMEFLNLGFLTVELYFPSNCFQILLLELRACKTQNCWNFCNISTCSRVWSKIWIFIFNSVRPFFDFCYLYTKMCQKSSNKDRIVLFFPLESRDTGLCTELFE